MGRAHSCRGGGHSGSCRTRGQLSSCAPRGSRESNGGVAGGIIRRGSGARSQNERTSPPRRPLRSHGRSLRMGMRQALSGKLNVRPAGGSQCWLAGNCQARSDRTSSQPARWPRRQQNTSIAIRHNALVPFPEWIEPMGATRL